MCEPPAGQHSRESSISQASSDSLVLSVSALSRRGPPTQSPRSEESNESLSSELSYQCSLMGGAASNSEETECTNMEGRVRLEPEGINETDSQNFNSFLSVDKRLFGRLQEELTQAQSQLKLKEEQVVKLSRIRDDVEREMEDLTASLFQVRNQSSLCDLISVVAGSPQDGPGSQRKEGPG